MNRLIPCILLLASACHEKHPPTPTAEQSAQLDNAEDMLNDLAQNDGAQIDGARNEEGPEQRPGPSSSAK